MSKVRSTARALLRVVDPLRVVALHRRIQLLMGAECGRGLVVTHRAELLLHGPAPCVTIGDHVILDGSLECYGAGTLTIGNHVFIGRSRVYAAHSVHIGDYALVSDGVCIMDSDLHPLSAERRREIADATARRVFPDVYEGVAGAPVEIEPDVWIGYGAAVLKGVRVGRGAIVAAGAVITRDVPPWTVVAGAPATVIRQLNAET